MLVFVLTVVYNDIVRSPDFHDSTAYGWLAPDGTIKINLDLRNWGAGLLFPTSGTANHVNYQLDTSRNFKILNATTVSSLEEVAIFNSTDQHSIRLSIPRLVRGDAASFIIFLKVDNITTTHYSINSRLGYDEGKLIEDRYEIHNGEFRSNGFEKLNSVVEHVFLIVLAGVGISFFVVGYQYWIFFNFLYSKIIELRSKGTLDYVGFRDRVTRLATRCKYIRERLLFDEMTTEIFKLNDVDIRRLLFTIKAGMNSSIEYELLWNFYQQIKRRNFDLGRDNIDSSILLAHNTKSIELAQLLENQLRSFINSSKAL